MVDLSLAMPFFSRRLRVWDLLRRLKNAEPPGLGFDMSHGQMEGETTLEGETAQGQGQRESQGPAKCGGLWELCPFQNRRLEQPGCPGTSGTQGGEDYRALFSGIRASHLVYWRRSRSWRKIAPSEDLTADDGLTLQTLGRSHTASSILCTKLALGPFQLHVACQVSSAASTQTPESYADAWIFWFFKYNVL